MDLHPYQEVARDHLRAHPRAALLLDMGLGKTAATLTALEPRHLPALVVAPKRVAESVWPSEGAIWRPDLSLKVAAGGPQTRWGILDTPADITVLGRDNLGDLLDHPTQTFRTVVLDELSGFKERNTNRWRSMTRILRARPEVSHVWGLTGTPTPNGLLDLWSQTFLIDNGQRLGTSITKFRGRYFIPTKVLPSGIVTEWTPRPETPAAIYRLLEDIFLSMSTDGRIELPLVTINPVTVNLPPGVWRTYQNMKRDLVADLRLMGGSVHTAANAAILTNKLSQISAGFLYPDNPEVAGSAPATLHWEKTRAVIEIVEGTGSPVLVFYRYIHEVAMIRQMLPSLVHTMDEPGVVERWNRGEIPVLVAHPASAGHGLNLQHGGHTIVWTSLPWSMEEWEQANKRLARQGQKHPVVIHMLLAARTVDAAIRKRLQDKVSVQSALLAHLESLL